MVAIKGDRRQRRAALLDGAFWMTMDNTRSSSALQGGAPASGVRRKDDRAAGRSRMRGWLIGGVVAMLLGLLVYAIWAEDGLHEVAQGPIAQLVPDAAADYSEQFAGLAQAALDAGFDADAIELLEVSREDLPNAEAAMLRLREFNGIAAAAGEARVADMRRANPWLDPGRAATRSPARQRAAAELEAGLDALRERATMIDAAASVEEGVAATRATIAAVGRLDTPVRAASADTSDAVPTATPTPVPRATSSAVRQPPARRSVAPPPATVPGATASATDTGVSSATARDFARIVGEARAISDEVANLAKTRKPRRDASDGAHEAYRTRQASARSARQYVAYLDTLEASMRGTETEAEARNSVVKASQTKAYLLALLNRSRAAQQAR